MIILHHLMLELGTLFYSLVWSISQEDVTQIISFSTKPASALPSVGCAGLPSPHRGSGFSPSFPHLHI